METTIILTGAAGFIGSHLADRLLGAGRRVVGFDNFNDFYDPATKRRNAARTAARHPGFALVEGDLRRADDVERLFGAVDGAFTIVHLAAMAGVRPSLDDPMLYQDVNVTGTYVLLEAARRRDFAGYVFGSSSSVYGGSVNLPFREDDDTLDPLSPYAATKLLGEQIAYVYHVCHGIPATCLRFFTVYGPRQRPEMAIHQFARKIRDGEEITLYGEGGTTRDYTYVDDIVDGISAAVARPQPFEVVNLGGGNRVTLLEMVGHLENALEVKARVRFVPAHLGDMRHTWADVSKAARLFDYAPKRPFETGIETFVRWFRAEDEARIS